MKTIKPSIILLAFIMCLQNVSANDNPAIVGNELSVDARTYYDIQSNGSSFMIEQNPANPQLIHAIFLVSTDPGPGYINRKARYFYTTNGGSSWEYIGTVSNTRSGVSPVLQVTNDNRAIVCTNSNDGGGAQRFQLFVDFAPGVGSWSVLDPPGNYIGGNSAIDLSSNKLFFNVYGYANVCTSLNSPGTFVGYSPIPDANNSTAVGVGTGKTGIAYITSGSVKLIETTNGGVDWSLPQNIWNWRASDSTGALRGIDMVYNGTTPQVIFELCHVDPMSGNYSPKQPSKIAFWSPAVNGGIPVTVDSAAGLSGSNPINDVYTSLARPVIGKLGGNVLGIAYCKARQDTNATGNNYYDIYFKCSNSGGLLWGPGTQLTNLAGQFAYLNDCRYPSISNSNANNEVHIACQIDTIPGTNVNGSAESLSKMYYIKITPGGSGPICAPIGINNTGNEIPSSYTLKQNYPNPFNPVTQIEFALPVKSLARITIYNTLGEVITVLLNENLSAGNYKVDWNASAYPSGVYFYELKTDGFTETRKMVLIK